MSLDEFRERWRDAHGGHERLKWARLHWQMKAGAVNGTGTDAATSIGWKPGTYLAYERQPTASKHTPLDHQAAIEFARRFGVSWHWLLLGQGTPFDDQLPPAQARVVRAMAEANEEQQNALAEMVEAFLRSRVAEPKRAAG